MNSTQIIQKIDNSLQFCTDSWGINKENEIKYNWSKEFWVVPKGLLIFKSGDQTDAEASCEQFLKLWNEKPPEHRVLMTLVQKLAHKIIEKENNCYNLTFIDLKNLVVICLTANDSKCTFHIPNLTSPFIVGSGKSSACEWYNLNREDVILDKKYVRWQMRQAVPYAVEHDKKTGGYFRGFDSDAGTSEISIWWMHSEIDRFKWPMRARKYDSDSELHH